jgi:hypothetical protein
MQPTQIAGGCSEQSSMKDTTRNGESDSTRHILLDFSNVYIKPRNDKYYNTVNKNSIKINIPELNNLLHGNERLGTRLVACSSANSKPPSYCSQFKQLGYRVNVCPRDRETGKEIGVDTSIHAVGLQLVIDRSKDPPGSNTLVLVTGDGNDHDGSTSYPKLVKAAVDNDFRVEIWSWSSSLNSIYREIVKNHQGWVSIHYFDNYRDKICFVEKS